MDVSAVFHHDEALKCLICKTHGYAVHPTTTAIVRHLRGQGHWESGARLKNILSWCMRKPLCSDPSRLWSSTQFLRPPPYLQQLDGYGCDLCCEQSQYLTTSLELMQKHVVKRHRRSLQPAPWQRCKLLTLFKETKHRHYRRARECDGQRSFPCLVNKRPPDDVGSPRYDICNRHPMAMIASRYVHSIPVSTLDLMFKSPSFRIISRPLFTAAKIEAHNAMFVVFPGSESDPLYFQALVYALIRVSPENLISETQHLHLERTIVRQLQERVTEYQRTQRLAIPTIGALLLLKVAAYKTQDTHQHSIHSAGVTAMLGAPECPVIPEPMKRGIFWQDLYAAMFVQSERVFGHLMAYGSFDSLPEEPLPVGFARASSHLGQDLCDCIVDTIRFDKLRRELVQEPWSHRYQSLDCLQASIESRLEAMTVSCRERGHLAEVVRLATWFWCYCSWMEIWNDMLVPCEILRRMLDTLQRSLRSSCSTSLWLKHADLFYWLVSIAADVLPLATGNARDIAEGYHASLALAGDMFANVSPESLNEARDRAELDFGPHFPWPRRKDIELPLLTGAQKGA